MVSLFDRIVGADNTTPEEKMQILRTMTEFTQILDASESNRAGRFITWAVRYNLTSRQQSDAQMYLAHAQSMIAAHKANLEAAGVTAVQLDTPERVARLVTLTLFRENLFRAESEYGEAPENRDQAVISEAYFQMQVGMAVELPG